MPVAQSAAPVSTIAAFSSCPDLPPPRRRGTRPRTGLSMRPFTRSPPEIPAMAAGRKLSPRTPATGVRVPRRPGRTTDRDRGRPAHAAPAPLHSAPTSGTKGRVLSRGGLFIPKKIQGSIPPDGNRLLSGKAQRLSSAHRPPATPDDNTAERAFVRRATQSPPSPAGSQKSRRAAKCSWARSALSRLI